MSDVKWYAITPAEVASQLQVDPVRGLSTTELQQHFQQYGPNKLADKKKSRDGRPFCASIVTSYRSFCWWLRLSINFSLENG
nr:cation-transporting P-type ATPase [Methanosarcina barkeri]